MFVIVGAASAVISFLPKLSIEPSGTVRSQDPMGTVFQLGNDGPLPIWDIEALCYLEDVNTTTHNHFGGFGFENPNSHADKLSSGHKMTLPCMRWNLENVAASAKMDVLVSYRPIWALWHRHEAFLLEAEKARDGTWVWKSIPN
jgi:hypothetical protein